MQPIVYTGRPLLLPGKCKGWRGCIGLPSCSTAPVKPSRVTNSLGSRVLEQARDLLQRTEALKSLASSDAEPHGLLRIGLAHALAEGTPYRTYSARLQLRNTPRSDCGCPGELTSELFHRLLAGVIDVAAVLLPEGKTAPPPLLTNIIASDRMEIVQGAAGNVDGDWKSLGRAPWVLNPPEFLSSGKAHRSDGACRLHPNDCG